MTVRTKAFDFEASFAWQIIATLKKGKWLSVNDYEMHELYDALSYSKNTNIKSVHVLRHLIMKCMNDYDAFSYSNNYFALNDLILILSLIISVWHHVKPNFIQS